MYLESLLRRALAGEKLSRGDLVRLLEPKDQGERSAIRAAAREARFKMTGEIVFTYGFVYLSTYCRNDCRFCAYRRSNGGALRYRKTLNEVLDASRRLAASGVNLIDLTMGEDPAADQPDFVAEMADLVYQVKKAVELPVMISPGVAKRGPLKAFRQAGADWYACYQETHNGDLFARLRPQQSYKLRMKSKIDALRAGLLVEEGVLCGVGESSGDLADSILAMKALGAQQVRAMGFVPPAEARADASGRWVPVGGQSAQEREIDMIAVLRLAMPETLIPASLDVEGLAGLKDRLEAGANLITSLVPADLNLAGVAQASLDIDNQARSVEAVRPVAAACGLRLGGGDEYRAWLEKAYSDFIGQPRPLRAGASEILPPGGRKARGEAA